MSPHSTIAAFVFLLLAATSSFGQDSDDAGDLFRQFVEDKARALSLEDTQEHDLRELVGMILKVRVCSVLELEEEKCITLMARVGGALDKLHDLKWERGAIKYYLKGVVRDPKLNLSKEELFQKYERAKKLDFKIEGLTQTIGSMSEGILTLERQIGLYIFLDDFSNEMNRLVRKAQRVTEMNRAHKEEPKPSGENRHKPDKPPSK
jgi:hypothetical protein